MFQGSCEGGLGQRQEQSATEGLGEDRKRSTDGNFIVPEGSLNGQKGLIKNVSMGINSKSGGFLLPFAVHSHVQCRQLSDNLSMSQLGL